MKTNEHRVVAQRFAASFLAVATSAPMPGWPEYKRVVHEDLRSMPRAAFHFTDILRVVDRHPIYVRGTTPDLIASLISFVDDHVSPVPADFFPKQETLEFMNRVAEASARGDRLDAPRQLALALDIANDMWTALLVCHLGTRQLARGRDTRALGAAARFSVQQRCERGRAIAPFPDELSQGGDPLGDTYHYWANVIAGVASATLGASRGRALHALFYQGPRLMLWIRERTFGSPLFFGNHMQIDRLGLAHGRQLIERNRGT